MKNITKKEGLHNFSVGNPSFVEVIYQLVGISSMK